MRDLKTKEKKQWNKSSVVLLFVGLFFFMSACDNQAELHQLYHSLPGSCWSKEDNHIFGFEISEESLRYDLSFRIRNNNLYPYRNLWLFYSLQDSLGSVIARDSMECILADQYGNWMGKGISLFESEFRMLKSFSFPDSGHYTIGFSQGFRQEVLPGIQEIGLVVRKEERSF